LAQIRLQQQLVSNGIAVGEMFFNDLAVGSVRGGMDLHGSSVIDHTIADNYSTNIITVRRRLRRWVWTDVDASCTNQVGATRGANIHNFISRLLACTIGKAINLAQPNFATHSISVNEVVHDIPIPNLFDQQEPIYVASTIRNFMTKAGLRYYGIVQVQT
jgi:hypothetical protein